jgi:hypothetical protein
MVLVPPERLEKAGAILFGKVAGTVHLTSFSVEKTFSMESRDETVSS